MSSPFPIRWLAAACVFAGAAVTLRAQTIELRDGTTAQALGLRRDGTTLMAKVKTQGDTVGEVGYPIANIARVVFPDPPQLRSAATLLDQGKAEEAVRQVAPVLAYYAPFYDVPGNWWKPLALLQLDALSAARHEREADALMADLGKYASNDPEVARILKIKQGGAFVRRNEAQKAIELLEPLTADATLSPDAVAEAWLQLGAAHLSKREPKPALLAFLHVPVYTPDRVLLMPAALLGSARALLALDDKTRARATLNELVTAYPATPEAAEAKQQLQRLDPPGKKPPGG